MNKDKLVSNKIALVGIMTSLALILSFVETLIPLPIAIPGIKLGLANLVIVFEILNYELTIAATTSVLRVLLSGFLFGNMVSIAYSLAGAIISLAIMYVCYRALKLHPITVSICGAVAHVVGQMTVASIMTSFAVIVYYAPPILLAALVTGCIIGVLVCETNKRIKV